MTTHGYKCNSRWYADRDARLIEDYRLLGLEQAAERAGLCVEYTKNLLIHYGAIERVRYRFDWRVE